LAANTTTLSFRLAGILFLLVKLSQPIEMSALSFSFSSEATAKVHDALICLAKFGETVCMEARGDIVNFHKCMICLLGFANVWTLAHFDDIEFLQDLVCFFRSGRKNLLPLIQLWLGGRRQVHMSIIQQGRIPSS
jgi:hypothetical protein